MPKILVACEESQAVTIAFRNIGFEAYSCDIEPCSGGHPEWHLQQDVLPLLDQDWDMLLAFPPCTHLASSGARWFAEKIADGRQQQAVEFFLAFTRLKCPLVAIENPIGVMSRFYRRPDQIIQPFMFGHMESKQTCLWLKGLPPLVGTKNVYEQMMALPLRERNRVHYMPPSADRSRSRSVTYQGIAEAMAEQWSRLLC